MSIMPEMIALKDVNILPECGRTNESSGNGNLRNPNVDPIEKNGEERQEKKAASVVDTPIKRGEHETCEGVANSEIEYIESKNLEDVEDVECCLKTLILGLNSKDWISVCDALNNVRRLSIFHKDDMVGMLNDVVSLIVKSLKNPRSAVCKTAVMTSADIFKAYNDDIIDLLDPLLLLKSSQDKRFVCEAAESALIALSIWVSPLALLPKLQPHIQNRNPRIRAKASMCISRSVPRLGAEGIEEFGIDKLILIGASQLSDQLPESREAARMLLLELQAVFEKSRILEPVAAVTDKPVAASWEHFCQSKLSPLSAQAVLRVTSIAREGIFLHS
ncbi:uncharacterized protein [Henckelia pumila]|uniref:uncharacterized protein isoform X2 n=1 Tax=Henckelia pumila TaxID=405737 RepID=UPI003C6E2938